MNMKNIKEILEQKNEELKGSDSFLAKDVLTLANKLNGSRSIMFHGQTEQYVVLKETEFPKVFTGYENAVARYSNSIKKVEKNLTVVDKIVKNQNNYILIVKDENNHYDVIYRKEAEHLTESYCYAYKNDVIDGKKTGDVLEEGEILYKSTSFDDSNNYGYGRNANCCYLICNETTEDAIVASESFVEKMQNNYLTKIEVSINTNDLLLNLYGDNTNYKPFPDIGESTNGKVLVARRRISYETALYDLKTENLRKINYVNDSVFYEKGRIVDIDIFCNKKEDELDDMFYGQIKGYLAEQRDYYQKLREKLRDIIEDETCTYSDDIGFLYKKSNEYLDVDDEETERKWENDGVFDNIIINFTVMSESKLMIGSKISGRFGNKGVISKILPDEEMPISETGVRADLILNALGVVNRLNPGQLFEQELNFISDNIVNKAKTLETVKEQALYILDYIKTVNEEQYRELVPYVKRIGVKKFLSEIYTKGIYIHQPPFWNNVNIDELKEIYKKYDWIQPYKCYIKGKELLNRLIIAQEYFMLLKHQPKTKLSVRSTSYLNNKDMPSKNMAYKRKQALYSSTPIKLGEMEHGNLLMSLKPEEINRMTSMYATSKANRENTVKTLLTSDDIFNIEEIETVQDENNNRKILNIYMKNMGLEIED